MIPTLKAVIIEDEENSYVLLKKTLEEYCDNVDVIAHAATIKEGRKLLSSISCDVVFMDVEIKDGKSFEILEMISETNFQIIFTTAYDHYAIKAIKLGAIDYLLKPYSPNEVVKSIQKVRLIKEKSNAAIHQTNANRIKLNTKEGIELVEKNEIIYCSAEGSYTVLYLLNDRRVVLSKTLKDLEISEDFATFERIHSSYLINKEHIKKYVRADGGWVIMSNGKELSISRRKKQDFLDNL